jgi:hypothetical protein
LARLEAPLDFVNDVDAPFAADQTIGAMPAAQGFQGVADFHLLFSLQRAAAQIDPRKELGGN